jgi:putative PIN family toxin of toxin-antitoxin system
MRIFFDTNVLVSALTTHGVCAELLRIVIKSHELILSEQVLAELQRILRDRFDATAQEVRAALELLSEFHVQMNSVKLPDMKVRDPDDLVILSSAIDANVDVLVTGDKDLLSLASRSPIKIVSPRSLMEML